MTALLCPYKEAVTGACCTKEKLIAFMGIAGAGDVQSQVLQQILVAYPTNNDAG
jgi:hypothetical protein